MNRQEKALQILHEGTVIPAIPLVLDKNRRFNAKGQRRLIRYYMNAGVGGLAVAVHTTQFEIRDPQHQLLRPVLEITADEITSYERATGKTLVRIAGVCGDSRQACEEAILAKELGFDAVLLSPGGLNHWSEEDMLQRTREVAAIMPVIGFYLQNSVGGRRFSFDYWKRLSDIPNVVAIKSAPFNRYFTLDLVRGCAFSERRDEIALYTGNDDNIVVDLLTRYEFDVNGTKVSKRFVGGLLGHWSVWTKRVMELYHRLRECQESDTIPSDLLTLAAEITDCNGAFFDVANNFTGCIAGIHEVLHRQGLLEGIWCLNPEETLSPGQLEEINRVYRMYPFLNDDAFIAEHLEEWKC
jgi:dihydrodipicolinate synthase/N-acetylneuraminate lyase